MEWRRVLADEAYDMAYSQEVEYKLPNHDDATVETFARWQGDDGSTYTGQYVVYLEGSDTPHILDGDDTILVAVVAQKSWAEEHAKEVLETFPTAEIDIVSERQLNVNVPDIEVNLPTFFERWFPMLHEDPPTGNNHIKIALHPDDEDIAIEIATRHGVSLIVTDEPYVYKVIIQ